MITEGSPHLWFTFSSHAVSASCSFGARPRLDMNRSDDIEAGEICDEVFRQIVPADLSIIAEEERLIILPLFRRVAAGRQIPEMMMGIDDRNRERGLSGQACQQVDSRFQLVSPPGYGLRLH
jgi:hypothetical protein